MGDGRGKRMARAVWPWLVLALVAGVAAWHVLDFSEGADPEFPRVVRPTFNRRPPAAYRLAEPGDTLDRVGLYFAAGSVALAALALGVRRGRDRGLWPTALALALAAAWHASTPGPTFDGWHGLGWRVVLDPAAPIGVRLAVGAWGLGLVSVAAANLARAWPARRDLLARARAGGMVGLLAASAALVAGRQGELPGVEPAGYWPRCSFDLGMLAFALALVRARPLAGTRAGWARRAGLAAGWASVVVAGIGLTVLHRPLARLRPVVPGRIYISAMPTYRGLAIEQGRLRFRTIINLFDESSDQGSPRHEDEIRFVREHGLRYLGSPSDGLESDRFLDETLALARDPTAWPILVHCHGCMDRSPAWMGMYRFLVEGRPLAEVFREIERHRGTRPKAVVTLQYNRKLPKRAPGRFAADPTARLLLRNAATTADPFEKPAETAGAIRRVVTRVEPDPAIDRP